MSYPGIEGKVAVVTGAGGGIGEEYAKRLSGEGAKVVIAEIDEQKGSAVASSPCVCVCPFCSCLIGNSIFQPNCCSILALVLKSPLAILTVSVVC